MRKGVGIGAINKKNLQQVSFLMHLLIILGKQNEFNYLHSLK